MPEELQAPTSQGIIPKPGDAIATPQATGIEVNKVKEKGSEALPDDRHEDLAQWMATPTKLRRMQQYEFAKLRGVVAKTICDWENRPDVIARAAFLTKMSKERGQIIVWREWPNIVGKQTEKALGGHDWSAEFCKEVGYPEEQVQAAAQANVGISLAEALADTEGPLKKPTWMAREVLDVPAEPEKGKEEDVPK